MVRRGRAGRRVLSAAAVVLLTVALSPLVMVAGEPLRRYVLASPARRRGWYRVWRPRAPAAAYSYAPAGTGLFIRRRRSFWIVLVSNPLWIALTAPARWLADRASGYRHRGHGRPGPPDAGVREPRRPRPDRPAGAIALAEPRTTPVIARLLGLIRRGPDRQDDPGKPVHRPRVRRPGTRRRNGPAT